MSPSVSVSGLFLGKTRHNRWLTPIFQFRFQKLVFGIQAENNVFPQRHCELADAFFDTFRWIRLVLTEPLCYKEWRVPSRFAPTLRKPRVCLRSLRFLLSDGWTFLLVQVLPFRIRGLVKHNLLTRVLERQLGLRLGFLLVWCFSSSHRGCVLCLRLCSLFVRELH